MTKTVCPCYRVKPQTFYAFGQLMYTAGGGVLGYRHDLTCHPECRDNGPGYCTDEVYVDVDSETVNHDVCGLQMPKQAWLHCGPC